MKKIFPIIIIVSAIFCTGSTAISQASGLKIGYVDFNRALNETLEGKKAKDMLKAEFSERQKKLDNLQDQLKKMKEELDKQRLILSEDVLATKEDEYRNKFLELQQKLTTFKQEMTEKEGSLTSGILEKLKGIVKDIGSKEGYTIILEKSQEVVLYTSSGDDVTNRVIELCNSSPKSRR